MLSCVLARMFVHVCACFKEQSRGTSNTYLYLVYKNKLEVILQSSVLRLEFRQTLNTLSPQTSSVINCILILNNGKLCRASYIINVKYRQNLEILNTRVL